jgi:hypothetical protein
VVEYRKQKFQVKILDNTVERIDNSCLNFMKKAILKGTKHLRNLGRNSSAVLILNKLNYTSMSLDSLSEYFPKVTTYNMCDELTVVQIL